MGISQKASGSGLEFKEWLQVYLESKLRQGHPGMKNGTGSLTEMGWLGVGRNKDVWLIWNVSSEKERWQEMRLGRRSHFLYPVA